MSNRRVVLAAFAQAVAEMEQCFGVARIDLERLAPCRFSADGIGRGEDLAQQSPCDHVGGSKRKRRPARGFGRGAAQRPFDARALAPKVRALGRERACPLEQFQRARRFVDRETHLRQAQQLLGGGRRGRGSSEAAMAVLEAPAATARARRVARDRGGAHEAMEEGMGEERFSHAACSRSSRAWVKRAMSNSGWVARLAASRAR